MAQYTRTMGLDVGSVTVGVAVSDLMGWTAQGLTTLRIDEEADDYGLPDLIDLIDQEDVDRVVIGLPKNMDNTIGPRAQASLDYGQRLEALRPDLTIIYQDERLTTRQAERFLVDEFDLSRAKRKQVIDQMAATFILQSYLDSQ